MTENRRLFSAFYIGVAKPALISRSDSSRPQERGPYLIAWDSPTNGYNYRIRSNLVSTIKPEMLVMNENDEGTNKEPDWMNPANDRKTPYTEEEIDILVEGFILGLDNQDWLAMKSELGEQKAREKIRAGIVKLDEKNLANMTPKGLVN